MLEIKSDLTKIEKFIKANEKAFISFLVRHKNLYTHAYYFGEVVNMAYYTDHGSMVRIYISNKFKTSATHYRILVPLNDIQTWMNNYKLVAFIKGCKHE